MDGHGCDASVEGQIMNETMRGDIIRVGSAKTCRHHERQCWGYKGSRERGAR